MAKVFVVAKSDFYDRGNQIQRRKGDEFTLRSDYAKTVDVTTKKKEEEKPTVKKEKKQLSANPGASIKTKKK